jgi:hypothetical protein
MPPGAEGHQAHRRSGGASPRRVVTSRHLGPEKGVDLSFVNCIPVSKRVKLQKPNF